MKPHTVTFEAYDVVVVPFPFTDSPIQKRRPALVLSGHRAFNTPSGHAVMAMITSRAPGRPRWPLDTVLQNWHEAGLSQASLVRMKLFTLGLRFVLRKSGQLSQLD